MSKHTPGPLDVVSVKSCDGTCQVPVVRSRGSNFNIARFATGFNDKRYAQAYADAHLFAAAPSLLEALEAIVDGGNVHHGTCSKVDASDIEVARQAIKKARG